MEKKITHYQLKNYLNIIRPYVRGIINYYKAQGQWKIDLTMAINFFSSKDSEETRTMYSKNDNIEVMMGSETDKMIEGHFDSFLQRYQKFSRINDRK